jgi:16S rRNA (cytosine967-C5)-methyltransferase
MTNKARTYALFIIKASLEDGRWANRLLPYFRSRLDKRDRDFLTEITYGTIKMKLALDYAISKYLKGYDLTDLTPWIRTILRMGTYEIIYHRNSAPYAVVNESVQLAKRFGHRGVAGLVNAVLRRISERPQLPSEPWLRYSHPRWLFERWKRELGEEGAIRRMKHNNSPPPIYIRANTLRISSEALLRKIRDLGGDAEKREYPEEALRVDVPPQELGLDEELYYAQDLSTQIVSYLATGAEVRLFLDGTVAPGGKASHIYALYQGKLRILGMDRLQSRLVVTKRVFDRLGVKNYWLICADTTDPPLRESADLILLDVPCSGLGTLRRRAELRWRMSEKKIKELSQLQRMMLEGVAPILRKGGVLIYATCTTEPEENQLQIEKFLKDHKEFERVSAEDFVPEAITKDGYLDIDGKDCDCDYAFAARLVKVGS